MPIITIPIQPMKFNGDYYDTYQGGELCAFGDLIRSIERDPEWPATFEVGELMEVRGFSYHGRNILVKNNRGGRWCKSFRLIQRRADFNESELNSVAPKFVGRVVRD